MQAAGYQRLIMLGTTFETRGGIAAVVNAYRGQGLFERWPISYIATHCEGGALRKLLTAVKALLTFVLLLARERRVIIHVHSASRASFWRKSIFMTIGMLAKCPVILHLHGGGFARFYETECGAVSRRLVRLFLDRAAFVVVLSDRWRAWVSGITRNPRIACIPNPVAAIAGRADTARRNLVLFLGRLERDKGVFDLLDAAFALRASIPDFRLVCAGAGDLESVGRYAQRLGIEDAVSLPGWIGPAERESLLARAAVLALPSYAEGLPMSLLEAMAAGVPVVATRAGGIPDLVSDGVNGFLFAPGDTATLARLLRALLLDPELGRRVASSARETVRLQYAADEVVAQLEEIYASFDLESGHRRRCGRPASAIARGCMKRPVAIVLGPHREAVSGVSTHLNLLFASPLAGEFSLVHFQVGSEGRAEGRFGRLVRLLVSPFCLAAVILARGAAIVHLNTSLNTRAYWRDLVYLIVAKLCGARVLYQVHGGKLPQQFLRGSRALTALLRLTLLLPDTIVVLARSELDAYREFVPRQQVLVLPNGIDCAPYAKLSRARFDGSAPLELVYIGRLAREKGLFEALEGLKLARAQGARARIVIAGSGPEEARLQRLAGEIGIADAVSFRGPVFGEDKVKLLADAHALVLASHGEGLPYALLEAMAAGAAVIATRVGAIPDVAVDGVHGLLVPPRDAGAIARAIARLASEPDSLARMSAACRKRIAVSYSMERIAGEFCRLYSELCAAKRMKALIRS